MGSIPSCVLKKSRKEQPGLNMALWSSNDRKDSSTQYSIFGLFALHDMTVLLVLVSRHKVCHYMEDVRSNSEVMYEMG